MNPPAAYRLSVQFCVERELAATRVPAVFLQNGSGPRARPKAIATTRVNSRLAPQKIAMVFRSSASVVGRLTRESALAKVAIICLLRRTRDETIEDRAAEPRELRLNDSSIFETRLAGKHCTSLVPPICSRRPCISTLSSATAEMRKATAEMAPGPARTVGEFSSRSMQTRKTTTGLRSDEVLSFAGPRKQRRRWRRARRREGPTARGSRSALEIVSLGQVE